MYETEAYGPATCEEGKNVLFPGKTVASKICVPSTSSFEAPGPSTHGHPEQLAANPLPEVKEAEQVEPCSTSFSQRDEEKTEAELQPSQIERWAETGQENHKG